MPRRDIQHAHTLPESAWERGTTRMLPSQLFQQEDGTIVCHACIRTCHLHEGQVGACTQIGCHQGVLFNLAYGVVAEASATPIESKPVFHYWPGAHTLSLGGLGCNLRCRFCQNWEIAFRDARDAAGLDEPNLTPDAAAEMALTLGVQGLSWSHNEPSINPTYVIDSARAARAVGLFTVLVTNGLLTDAAIETLGPWVDVYRVDVKSRDPAFYRRVSDLSLAGDTIRIARRAQEEYGAHVEVVTNVMPGYNDDDDALARIAGEVATSLGPNAPWHLTTYIPYALMRHVPTTPLATLKRAREIGRRSGLRFVYLDHPEAESGADSICPSCGAVAIQRLHGRTRLVGVTAHGAAGHCATCGEDLNVIVPQSSMSAHADSATTVH